MQTNTTTPATTLDLLCNFVDQRPGLNPADYGGGLDGWRLYRNESAEITRDRSDFYELLRLASRVVPELEEKVTQYLTTSSDRLTLNGNRLQYITGQYFPTEYRPASSRVLVSILWREIGKQLNENATGHDIRKTIRRQLSRRVARLYFN